MKASRFSEAQKAFILKQGADGIPVADICRKAGISQATYFNWKKKYDGLLPSEMRRLRYGYRRVHVLLRREGCSHGQNKTRRIYRELGLQLRNKTPKRRVKAKLRDDRRPATRSNETWAMDFVHDQLATGRKLRVLTIVDTFSRFSPALEPRFTFRGADVVEVLERSAGKWVSRRRSGSTKAQSLSRAIWICGLISVA